MSLIRSSRATSLGLNPYRTAWQVGKAIYRAGVARRRRQPAAPSKGASKAIRDSVPLTSQNDFSSQYRKRRRRRGRRVRRRVRRAKRFYRAVRKVDESLLGSRIHVHTANGSATWAANQGTLWGLLNCLLAQSGSRELTIKGVRDNMLAQNVSLRSTTRLWIQTVCLDVSLTARSSNTAPVDLDVYVIRCRKNVARNDLGSGVEAFANSEGAKPNTNVGYIPVSDSGTAQARASNTFLTGTIGWTPWAAPNFCQFFTVISKKKILLTPGATTHLQLKKNVYRYLTLEDCDKFDAKAGLTFGYLFNAYSVYNGSQPLGGIDFNFEHYYNVKQIRDSEDTVVSL